MTSSLTVVMPAHNEAEIIESVVREFKSTLDNQDFIYEIVVVEDGSTDRTKNILRKMKDDINITIDLSDSRRGYSGGIKRGARISDSDYILFTDSDGQHLPVDLLKLWNHRDEASIIVGGRYDRAESLHRRLLSSSFQFITKAAFSPPPVKDLTAPLRLVDREVALDVIPTVAYMRESFWTEFSLRAHHKGHKQLEVPVRHVSRRGSGTTRVYHPSRLPAIVLRQTIALAKLYNEFHR